MQTNANAQRDLDTLTALNLDFFASVQKGDVKRFEEILADDFMMLDSGRLAARQGRVSQADGAAGDDQRACGRGRANPLAG